MTQHRHASAGPWPAFAFLFFCTVVSGYWEERPIPDPVECFRRTGQPCGTVGYGPYSGTFVLDTGAECAVAFAPESFLREPENNWTVDVAPLRRHDGDSEFRVIREIPITALDREFPHSQLGLLEDPFGKAFPRFYDGALGWPQLKLLRLRINVPEKIAAIDSRKMPADDRCVMVPIHRNVRGNSCVDVRIATSEMKRIPIDTGASGFLYLKASTLEYYRVMGYAIPVKKSPSNTMEMPKRPDFYVLRSLTLGGFEFRDVLVVESRVNAIGMGCFSYFDMVLDFPKDEMWLTPHSNEWPKRVPPGASGLTLVYLDTNVLSILDIYPDSVASKSELRTGDQILQFEGMEPKDLSMYEIRQRLTQAGTDLPLRIRRGDQEIDVSLPLKYSFEYPPKWSDKKTEIDDFNEFLEKEKER